MQGQGQEQSGASAPKKRTGGRGLRDPSGFTRSTDVGG